jgi:hypothetical protein
MADFRKWLFAFALIALIVGAGTANAQVNPGAAFTCVANAGNPVIVRVEGLTELVGDLILQCTGGTPTVAGSQIPVSNITLTLNTNITSRLLGGGYIDALLLIDEPWPTTPNPQNIVARPGNTPAQRVCQSNASPTTGSCNYLVGTGGGGYGSTTSPYLQAGASTVYVARQSMVNQVTWLGIPVDAPGTNGQTRIIRLTNVRANACQLGLSSTLIPTQIVGYIAINGSQFITINNPQQTLAYIQQGLIVGGPNTNLSQCNNLNVGGGGLGGNFFGGSGTGRAETAVTVREGFAASFKRAVYTGSSSTITTLTGPSTANGLPQNIPGFAYNTESGLNPDATPGSASGYGLASFGTRILIRFNNVSTGVRLVLPLYVPLTANGSSAPGNPVPATSGLGGWTGGFLQLIGSTSDVNGNVGTFAPSGSTSFNGTFNSSISNPFGGGAFASQFYAATEIPVNAGFATAVYEVVNTDPSAIEQASIPIGVAFVSNTPSNLPSPTVAPATSTQVSFAPLCTTAGCGVADAGLPIPRFCDRSTATSSFGITVCTCNLLFPFVTQAAGFDTGIAIANTTADPFGTAAQTGPVTMWFYGSMAGGGAVPGALAKQVTTGNVPAGSVLTWTAFGGAGAFGAGLSAVPGFTGYMIAQAQFQFCHGFAFISDLGAQKLAEGYLAIQLDIYGGSGLNRTGIVGEVQGH